MNQFQYKNNQFTIKDYDKKKPFASFLPGIAGTMGVPMWVYYVNRGQLISSFGIENKDHAILDFSPANMAYRRTEIDGFRTFLKINGKTHESFSSDITAKNRVMNIETNAVSIEETYQDITIEVKYFNVTRKNYPGLVRKVSLKNLSKEKKEVELIDGLATMWPYGTNAFVTKNMSNLAVAWFDVFNQENRMPFMKNRSTTEDTAEVGSVESGNFYVSVNQKNERLYPIYDPTLVFGYETSMKHPSHFESTSLSNIFTQEQVSVNQLVSGFSSEVFTLKDEHIIYTLFGQNNHLEGLNETSKNFTFKYFQDLESESNHLALEITHPMDIKTNYPLFDAYMKHSFLDNLLRGGYPLVFKGKEEPIIYHVYSRIHGDMEREYNNFFVEPAYFSHGNGSYRDVNQNRRNDVYFVPEAGLFNIRQFIELIQMDGHNPLTIQGSRLIVNSDDINKLLQHVKTKKKVIENILTKPFTPGRLMTEIDLSDIKLDVEPLEFLEHVMKFSTQDIESSYGTGYWSDHWVYNLDLVDQYLNVFPDHLEDLMLKKTYRFYQSHVSVFPRSVKYVLNAEGHVRQLGPLYHDEEKIQKTQLKVNQTNFHKDQNNHVFKVNYFTKLIHLALIKFGSLDPEMMGVMMDSEKPGWNDAMNGLPAIFGSGLSETVALKRLIILLIDTMNKFQKESYDLPIQFITFFNQMISKMDAGFDAIQDLRESFDRDTRFFVSSEFENISSQKLHLGLNKMLDRINLGIEKARQIGDGILPTYLTYEAKTYDVLTSRHPELGNQNVKVTSWSVRMLPHYLEAPANDLKITKDLAKAQKTYELIKQTELFDKKLGLYLTSRPLDDETLEIGRARAFTKGWLEREACFMHMSYKYLIGLMKSGLYQEYYQDIKTAMPPFMNPEVYGRSLLENSSFIATSNNPNPNNHGRGFVARLTGTTSEAITLLMLMMAGPHLFTYENDSLSFQIEPKLEKSFFDENQSVRFRLFDYIDITIKNPKMINTYDGLHPVSYELKNDVESIKIAGKSVIGTHAFNIRNKQYKEIIVTLE